MRGISGQMRFPALTSFSRSLIRSTIFQLFNTRLSRGGKVESCNGHVCKNNTICMLRSMRSESNCVSLLGWIRLRGTILMNLNLLQCRFALLCWIVQAVIRPGLSFKDRKRDTEVSNEHPRSVLDLVPDNRCLSLSSMIGCH